MFPKTLKCLLLASVLNCVRSQLQIANAIVALADKFSSIPLHRIVVLCKVQFKDLRYLGVSFLMTNRVSHVIENELWRSGSGIVCSQDIGWSSTLSLLQYHREFGFQYPWIVLHSGGISLNDVKLTVAQRVFFYDMNNGRLTEVYTTGEQVVHQIGTLNAMKLDMKKSKLDVQ